MNRRVYVISVTCLVVGVVAFALCGACLADMGADIAQAQSLMKAGHYDAAIQALNGVTEDYPTAAEPYRVMAECYSCMNKFAECYAAMNKAIELAADQQVKKGCKLDLARFYFKGKKYQDSLTECQSLIKDYPSDSEPYYLLAKCHANMNELKECYGAIDKAIELTADAQLKRYYLQRRGWFYIKGKRFQDALAEFAALAKDDRGKAAAYRGESECYAHLKQFPECYAAIDKAIELVKDTQLKKRYRTKRAWFYLIGLRYQDALAEYESLIKDYPDTSAEQYYAMAECYKRMDKNNECYDALSKAAELAVDPQLKRKIKEALAQLYLQHERYQESISEYQSLIKDYPNAAEPYYGLAECYARTGSEFCPTIDKAIELSAGSADQAKYLFVKAEMLTMYKRDYSSAIPILQKLFIDFPECYWATNDGPAFLAYALEKTGRIDEALEVIKSSLPHDATPEKKAINLEQIANIYLNAKKYREAIKVFKEVRDMKDAPSDTKAEATYRSGLCYKAINYDSSARICMNEVVSKYPDTPWAKRARGMLYVWDSYGESATSQ